MLLKPGHHNSSQRHSMLCSSSSHGLITLPSSNNPGHAAQLFHRLLRSFGNDMVTCGNTTPPKQFVLAFISKSLAENVELINILIRLRIYISQMEEIDTALCLQKRSLVDSDVRLDATPGIRTIHDPMVLRICQFELCTLYPILLYPDVSAAHNPPRCAD